MDSTDFQTVLGWMLDNVPENIDKREGSVIYTTLAPVALQIAQQNYMLTQLFNLLFADTAQGEWLDRVAADFGIDRVAATKSIRQISTLDSEGMPVDVPISSRFGIRDITFKVIERIDTGRYRTECEQYGEMGNLHSGEILPIDNINGLGRAELIFAPLIPARDAETDEAFRERFYLSVRQTPFGGNIADYEQKTLEIDGVGEVKVFNALSQGAGNVGIIIGDELGNKASAELVDAVQKLFGENGDGIAPVGHTVAVGTSVDLAVSCSAAIKIKAGSSFEIVRPIVEAAIRDCIESIRFTDETVFYAKLVAEILNSHESITDVGAVTLNGRSQNIALVKTYENYQVPIVGTISVGEAF